MGTTDQTQSYQHLCCVQWNTWGISNIEKSVWCWILHLKQSLDVVFFTRHCRAASESMVSWSGWQKGVCAAIKIRNVHYIKYIGFKMASSPRLEIGAATLAGSEHANVGLQQIWAGGGHRDTDTLKVQHSQQPIVMIAPPPGSVLS